MDRTLGWALCVAMTAVAVCLFALKMELNQFRKDVVLVLKTLGITVKAKAKSDYGELIQRKSDENDEAK